MDLDSLFPKRAIHTLIKEELEEEGRCSTGMRSVRDMRRPVE